MTKIEQYTSMIQENKNLLYKVASLYTYSKEDKEDLMQDMAYQLWKSFDSFQHKSKMSTWLYRVAMNTAIHYLKKEKTQVQSTPLPEVLQLENSTSTPENPGLEKLMKVIQQMNQLDKGIILLYLEEKSHKEIAEIIGISVSNVGTRMQRIKIYLKKKLNS